MDTETGDAAAEDLSFVPGDDADDSSAPSNPPWSPHEGGAKEEDIPLAPEPEPTLVPPARGPDTSEDEQTTNNMAGRSKQLKLAVAGLLIAVVCVIVVPIVVTQTGDSGSSNRESIVATGENDLSSPAVPTVSPTAFVRPVSTNGPTGPIVNTTDTPTAAPVNTTEIPTAAPVNETEAPSEAPLNGTITPTMTPVNETVPTIVPGNTTLNSTIVPSGNFSEGNFSSEVPSAAPTEKMNETAPPINVSLSPSESPSTRRSVQPSESDQASIAPVLPVVASSSPSITPTGVPSFSPSKGPSARTFPPYPITAFPTSSLLPSNTPTANPTGLPTPLPTAAAIPAPTTSPRGSPTFLPTTAPVLAPTLAPVMRPTLPEGFTASPTLFQTDFPTASPNTAFPTSSPTTSAPTNSPTSPFPTYKPTTTMAPTQRTVITLRNALRSVSLNPSALDNRSTPENAAMRWMHDIVTDGISGLTLNQLINNRARLRQRFAVVTLDFATQGGRPTEPKHATNRAMIQNLNECQFAGVTCNGSNRVTRIVWADDQLKGFIPSEVGQLTTITHLDLGENELKGTLPDSLYDLTLLQYLYLHSNQIGGPISEDISKLSRLVNLYLGDNQLSGTIPSGLGSRSLGTSNVRALRILNLNLNQLSGSIPANMNLRNLYYLDLGHNKLTGRLPSDWWEGGNTFSSLRHLYLSHNELNGPIPFEFVQIGGGRLIQLHIDHNSFTGIFPGGWDPRTQLESLSIQHNDFSEYSARLCGVVVFNGGEMTSFGSDCRICRCGAPFCRAPHCSF